MYFKEVTNPENVERLYMRKRLTLLLMALVFLVSGFFPAFAEEWYAFQKDESRSGMVKETLYFPLEERLRIGVGETLSGGLLVHDNAVFYSTTEGTIGACSIFNGEQLWSQKIGDSIKSCMMISNLDLFAISEEGHLYCIDAKTGTVLWTRHLETKVEAPLLKFYRYLIIAGVDGHIYALNALDGRTIWDLEMHESITHGICLKFNSLYVVTEKGQIACIDSQNGRKHWNYYVNAQITSPPIAGTEAIYFGDEKGNLYAYDYITGRQYWKQEFSNSFSTPFSFCYFDKRVLCSGITDQYVGIAAGTGVEMWNYPTENCTIAPVSANRVVFLPGDDNTIVALDSFDGTVVFSDTLDSPISAGMAISNGKLFIGTEDGDIIMYGSENYDFHIEIENEAQTISPGESCQFKVKVISTKGFHDPVSFSAGGFPCSCKGVARWFDKSQVQPPGEIVLVVDTTEEAQPAKYRIAIKAFSGKRDIEREAYAVLVIQEKGKDIVLSMETPKDIIDGQEFSIPIRIENADNVRSFGYTVQYPNDLLFLQDVKQGDFFMGNEEDIFFNTTPSSTDGKVSINYSRRDLGESGSGTLATLVFTAKTATKEEETATLSISNISIRDSLLFSKICVTQPISFPIRRGKKTLITLQIGSKTVKINDRSTTIEAAPYIKNGRTLVPLRIIAENMRTNVEWFADEQKIQLTQYDTIIELWINQSTCTINGVETVLPDEVAPEITNGRTFVPLRFATEQFNGKVDWNGSTQTITIEYPNYQ
jgi:outer membrane protein assembly factor BamB